MADVEPAQRAGGLPGALARAENRIVRPRDFAGVYSNARGEFVRLVDRGLLVRAAQGYYAIVPEDQRGGHWKPPVEAVALGIAVADYGPEGAALMGIAAARMLGVVPRALDAAVVAVPRQRPQLATQFGRVHFVKRAIPTLDLQRAGTVLVEGYTTTPEQTVLDLVARPTLGGITETTAREAILALWPRCDEELTHDLAQRQLKAQVWTELQRLVAANGTAR